MENSRINNHQVLKEEAIGFLKFHKLAVVSTISKEGMPESATVMFFVDEDLNLYFLTHQSTRKFRNLKDNKNIGIVVGTELAPGTIQIQGEAQWLENEGLDFVEKMSVDKELKELYYGPFLALEGKDFAVFKVKINWMRYLHLDLATNKENYYQIIG